MNKQKYNFEVHYTKQLRIIILNGPNLNLLGTRQPEVYGDMTFESYLSSLRNRFPDVDIQFYQSNVEGELIDRIHQCMRDKVDGIVINAGGYSHTSVALADAIAGVNIPTISVHISNIYQRETERHKELLAQYVQGGIYGLGLKVYDLAITALTDR